MACRRGMHFGEGVSLMSEKLVGVDIGSGGCKVVIIDSSGQIKGTAYQEWSTSYPHPGWSEQDPADWEKVLGSTMRAALRRGHIRPQEVAAIALGSATHSIVFLDGNDQVLRPAFLWTDKRTLRQVEWLKERHGDLIFRETLHAPNVNWSLPYLIWVREKEPQIWARTKRVVMPKDYMRFRLTGVWASDPIDAVGTLMFNPAKRDWSEPICNALDIPPDILPPLSQPEKISGTIMKDPAELLGLREGTPVITGTTDQAFEALGSGAIAPGQGIVKLATAGNVAVVTDAPHPDPLKVYAYLHIVPDQWYTLTGTTSCAVCYRWLRDTFFQDFKSEEAGNGLSAFERMDSMAGEVEEGCEGLFFHPNLHGSFNAPWLKGDFIGISFRHTRAHFARSVLEGIAFSLYEAYQRLEALDLDADDLRIIGGGSKSRLWQQIICDVFGRTIVVPAVSDSSFGAAILAAIATGIFRDVEEAVNQCVHFTRTLEPDKKRHELYQQLYGCYQETQSSLEPLYHKYS